MQRTSQSITGHGRVNGCEKMLLAESGEEAEALQLVFDGIFHFREAQFDTGRPQGPIEFDKNVGGGNVDAGTGSP